MQYRPRVHMVDVSSAHVCALTIGVQQPVHSATSVFPAKKSQEWDRSYAQNEAQKSHPQRISCWLLGDFFERNTSRVTALGLAP